MNSDALNDRTPSVTELHRSVDGTGLEISGMFATWDEDSAAEAFLPQAFDQSLPAFLKHNPVVMFNHSQTDAPIGRVLEARVLPNGLWGKIVLPKPALGTKAMEAYNAVRQKLIHTFSIGGFFDHLPDGKLLCRRITEVSLVSRPWNEHAVIDGVEAIQDVKAIGNLWVPVASIERQQLQRIELNLAAAEVGIGLYELRRR